MSSYHLNRFLFDLKMSEEILARALRDLDGALSSYDLSGAEKEALKAGDPKKLRQLGAHGMLSLYIMRLHSDFRTNIYWEQK